MPGKECDGQGQAETESLVSREGFDLLILLGADIVDCPNCDGSGWVCALSIAGQCLIGQTCQFCEGMGEVVCFE